MIMYQPKRILITGGAGFIGANFIHYLFNHHPTEKVINFDALTYAACLSHLSQFEGKEDYLFIKGDVCDRFHIEQVLREHDVDTIVHFAAESHVDRSISGPAQFIQTNYIGTFNVRIRGMGENPSPLGEGFSYNGV